MQIPESLLHAARSGPLNLLVGSGLSIDSGLPDWRGVLTRLAGDLPPKDQRAVARLCAANRLLDAAQILRQALSPSQLADLARSILTLETAPSDLYDLLWELGPAVVLTTNFDSLLESSYARVRGLAPNVITGIRSRQRRIGNGDTIVKLHGDLAEPDSLVLARSDYYQLMISALSQPNSVWAELIRRPTVAVGYSLSDPDIQLILHWLASELRGLSHSFYLLTARLAHEESNLLRSIPNVTLIEYPTTCGHHEAISVFLTTLATLRARATGASGQNAVRAALASQVEAELRVHLHELSNALTVARGSFDLYMLSLPDHSEAPEDLSEAYLGLKLVEERIDGIRRAALYSSDRLKPTPWSKCRDALVRRQRTTPSPKVEFQLAAASHEVLPLGPNLFALLVFILIDNGLHAVDGKPDGFVVVTCRFGTSQGRRILVTTVRDNGPGIPSEIKPRLFLSGTTTRGSGHGQGLYLLRILVDEMGGDVEITSSPSTGTMVSLTVPLSPARGVRTAAVRTAAKTPPKKQSVVVVDDEEVVSKTVSIALKKRGWRVRAFPGARAAISHIRRLKIAPACVIVDLVMPDLSGYEFGELVRERFPTVPLLFMSGFITQAHLVPLPLCGFIEKPFRIEELISTIEELTSD